jgi:RNA polymerase sigma-70 factor (ECF subfamily)
VNALDNPHHERRKCIGESTSCTLIERVKRGDAEDWQRLLYVYSPLVAAWCRRQGVTGSEVEDITQEVFATVSSRIADFQKQPGPSFRAWLRSIALNKLGDRLRRRSREPAHGVGGTDAQNAMAQVADEAGVVEIAPEADEHDDSDRRFLCRRALLTIRPDFEPRTWQAFWCVVVEDRRPLDVAAELGLSPNAVYIAKSRILARLRGLLVELGES